jgi:hypothetical protein
MNPEMREKILNVLKHSTRHKSVFRDTGKRIVDETLSAKEYHDLWLECIKFLENPEITYKIVRKSSTEEWVVRKYIDGKLDKSADYYTNDKHDAYDTKDFAERALKAGETII